MSVYICECVYVSVYMCVLVCVCVILIGDTYVADADGDQPSHIGCFPDAPLVYLVSVITYVFAAPAAVSTGASAAGSVHHSRPGSVAYALRGMRPTIKDLPSITYSGLRLMLAFSCLCSVGISGSWPGVTTAKCITSPVVSNGCMRSRCPIRRW